MSATTGADVAGGIASRDTGRAVVSRLRAATESWTVRVATAIILVTLLAAILAPVLTPYEPNQAMPTDRLLGFGEQGHLLGTDQLGRDVLTRLLYGARLAWIVGVAVSAFSLLLGIVLGAVSFTSIGWLDGLVSRIVDGVLAFPPILLALVLAAIMGPSTRTGVIALAIVYTPLTARIMRSTILSEKSLDYVDVSRGLGNRSSWTLLRHVLPNTVGPMIVVATVVVSRSIIVESSLSFLGAGTQPPASAWGLMVAEGRELILVNPSLVVVPAIVLSATVLSINLFSDGVADALDVSSTQRGRRGRDA